MTVQTAVAVHRAPWLLPITQLPICDGGLAVQAGRIIEIGSFSQVRRSCPGSKILDHPDAVLMPGLINAHTHLELSHLAHLSLQPAPPTFPSWIEQMLAERAEAADNHRAMTEAARTVLADQQQQGVVAVADISNTGLTAHFSSKFTGNLLCFKEYLGLRAAGLAASLRSLEAESDDLDVRCTAHALYSTHIDLLLALKKRARRLGHIFPIHVAESVAEHEMITRGRGEMRTFLEQRGFWDNSFPSLGTDSGGSVSYLHQYGLLDSRTLCVHCIHVTNQEINLLAEIGAKVCLCPGSNRYLGVGTAPAEKYLNKGILPALGTDSLTSNPELSLWREMRLLAEEHPGIAPADILRMATLGGAEALGVDKMLGSLEAGRGAVLAVALPEGMKNAGAMQEYLVYHGGRSIRRL